MLSSDRFFSPLSASNHFWYLKCIDLEKCVLTVLYLCMNLPNGENRDREQNAKDICTL